MCVFDGEIDAFLMPEATATLQCSIDAPRDSNLPRMEQFGEDDVLERLHDDTYVVRHDAPGVEAVHHAVESQKFFCGESRCTLLAEDARSMVSSKDETNRFIVMLDHFHESRCFECLSMPEHRFDGGLPLAPPSFTDTLWHGVFEIEGYGVGGVHRLADRSAIFAVRRSDLSPYGWEETPVYGLQK